ncbi:MAG: TetR family transcriptional regulator [Clostridia bacterium]|nr:TetR family transcriptional regulator [Clostridia bacterium]
MIKGTPELIAERRETIINACEELYREKSFKDITLKDIADAVPFSRPTIYNYFETKEEIFLALYKREYDLWNADLEKILEKDFSSHEELADFISRSLEGRGLLLRLLSVNNYDMEANSREEMLIYFKKSYGRSLILFADILKKNCSHLTEEEIKDRVYMFFPFMFGIYPYTSATEKQKKAMDEADIVFRFQTVYELCFPFLVKLFSL